MIHSIRGFVLMSTMLAASMLYTTTLLFPSLFLLIVPPPLYLRSRRLYRRWTGFVGYLFFAMAAYLLESLCRIKVNISGDVVPYGEPALIICNHRTRVDWMFLWSLCLRQGQLSGLKIVLKESLKSVPGFGWAAQMFLFVFLARNSKSKDVQRFREVSEYLLGLNVATTLLLFPEGTDLSPSNHLLSLEFARKEGLAEYQYVLHPKVRGFAACLRALRPALDAVHDVTIAYDDCCEGSRPSEKTMLSGYFPKEVHMHVRRHPIQVFATSNERLQEWCREAFTTKEARLKTFYEGSKTFAGAPGLDENEHTCKTEATEAHSRRTGRVAFVFFVALLVLVVGYGGTRYGLYALCAGCMMTLGTAFGGFDAAELYFTGPALRLAENMRELKQD